MNKTIKVKAMRNIAIIVFAAVIGFSFAACDDGNGTGGTAPAITTAALPNGVVNMAYNQTLAATGDTPITWSFGGGIIFHLINLKYLSQL